MPFFIESFASSSLSSPLPSPPSGCPLLKLPNEIIDAIHRQLAPSSAQALALTCKHLLNTLPALQPSSGPFIWLSKRLRSHELRIARKDFLLVLQKEYPNHWFCAKENRLVLGRPVTKPLSLNPRCRCDLANLRSRAESTLPGELKLHWGDIQLAMNRHFYGAPYGVALEYFAFKRNIPADSGYNVPRICPPCYVFGGCDYPIEKRMSPERRIVHWNEQWSARVIYDEFYLHGERTFNWEDINEQELRSYLRGENYWICQHLQLSSSKCTQAFDDKYKNDPRSRACNKCLTDFSTSITRRVTGDGKSFLRVVLKTYHYFGNSRHISLGHGVWNSALSCRTVLITDRTLTDSERFDKRRMIGCGAGQVRRAWEGEGTAEPDLDEVPPELDSIDHTSERHESDLLSQLWAQPLRETTYTRYNPFRGSTIRFPWA